MERVRDLVALLDEQLGPMKEAAEKSKIYKALQRQTCSGSDNVTSPADIGGADDRPV